MYYCQDEAVTWCIISRVFATFAGAKASMGLQLDYTFIIQETSSTNQIPPQEIVVPTNFNLEREEGNDYITLISKQYIADLEINVLLNLSVKPS